MRFGIIGFLHESNTFVSGKTSRDDFAACHLHIGQEIFEHWRDTHHEIGGFLAGAEQHEFEPVAISVAIAMPSGPLTEEAFESIWNDMSRGLRDAGRLDGILLALHGATVAVNAPDADGEIVSRLRAQIGPDLPVIMTLDLHANISPRMVAGVTATIAYRTTPHVDQFERGLEAATLMTRTARGEIDPVQRLETPPMLMNVFKQDSSEEPASTLLRRLEEVVARPGILSASIGFAYASADVEEMGTSVIVVADRDRSAAAEGASWLARQAWDMRREFAGELPGPAEAIAQAIAFDGQPVVVSDIGDNVGAGSPGDSTVLLAELVRQDAADALVVLWDPAAAGRCAAAGVGAAIDLEVGANTEDSPGDRVPISGCVRILADGRFFEPEPRHGGRSENDQGLSAVVETDQRHTIVLTSLRMAPLSLHQILSLGIDPKRKKIIVVKAVVAPRAAYAPVAAKFILCNTPGPASNDLSSFEYRHRRRPMFPWEPEAEYGA